MLVPFPVLFLRSRDPMPFVTLFSFVLFTGLVGLGTWLLTRKRLADTSEGYFLAGRSLTAGYIAGSLLLTNLSTEQLVGLNGAAFQDGLSVMAWEVIAGMSLVVMALCFLPRYLKSGITTIPQFLADRFNETTQTITTFIFLIAYAAILLPMLLYTGATGLNDILDMPELTGIRDRTTLLWVMVWVIGIIGSIYAVFGGLRAVAISDTLNGFGLLVGGILITWLSLNAVSSDGIVAAIGELKQSDPSKFNSLGGPEQSVPFSTLFTGVLLLNLFYWCTNQQIIQRAFAATTLAQGQKGVLLAGYFKVLAPLILVIPGIVAFHLYGRVSVDGQMTEIKDVTTDGLTMIATGDEGEVILHGAEAVGAAGGRSLEEAQSLRGQTVSFAGQELNVEEVLGPGVVIAEGADGTNHFFPVDPERDYISPRNRDLAYGTLVKNVLPRPLAGFFAAVVAGAILSSFNSVLNSSATLFSLGVYKKLIRPKASEHEIVRSGMVFGIIAAIASMLGAPFLQGQDSIFAYLQKMNGLYFIPIFAVVLVGMLSRRVPAVAANVALVVGFAAIAAGYFIPALSEWVAVVHEFHFLGIVFVSLIALMLLIGVAKPRSTPWQQFDSGQVDLTPWRFAVPAGLALVLIVLTIYIGLADTSVIGL